MPSFDIRPSGFFALRTPLLPFDEFRVWSEATLADAGTPREQLRERLLRLLERPEIREALFVAAPALEAGLDAWRRDPRSKKGRRAEETLVRYFCRMAARATPFGLFSGCSTGTLGERTRLRLASRASYQRHTRLDMDYLCALCDDLGHDREVRRRLAYRPNSSLYGAAGRLRYVETRRTGTRRSHHLVAADADDYLVELLDRAAGGATVDELALSLADSEEVELEEAEEFVGELIDNQLLESDLAPQVTGREPIHELIEQLARHRVTLPFGRCLEEVSRRLETLDRTGVGNDPESYRDVARRLEALPTAIQPSSLLQVDLFKPAPEASLGSAVVAEIERGIEVLWRWTVAPAEGPFDRFCREFATRYEGRKAVPLVEALDDEVGIGFETQHSFAVSPLLAGLQIPQPAGPPGVLWGTREQLLLRKLESAFAAGDREMEITDRDLAALGDAEPPPLPSAFHAMATIAAASEDDLDRGRFRVFLRHASGPSGARLLGRFCHADESLRRQVEDHLRAEEESDSDAVFAEVVHLPEGRIGNVLSRPVMRSYEIPFLGRSGAAADRRIPLDRPDGDGGRPPGRSVLAAPRTAGHSSADQRPQFLAPGARRLSVSLHPASPECRRRPRLELGAVCRGGVPAQGQERPRRPVASAMVGDPARDP